VSELTRDTLLCGAIHALDRIKVPTNPRYEIEQINHAMTHLVELKHRAWVEVAAPATPEERFQEEQEAPLTARQRDLAHRMGLYSGEAAWGRIRAFLEGENEDAREDLEHVDRAFALLFLFVEGIEKPKD